MSGAVFVKFLRRLFGMIGYSFWWFMVSPLRSNGVEPGRRSKARPAQVAGRDGPAPFGADDPGVGVVLANAVLDAAEAVRVDEVDLVQQHDIGKGNLPSASRCSRIWLSR